MSFHFQVVNAYDLFDNDPESDDDLPPMIMTYPNPDDFERVDEERNRKMVWNGGEAVMDALARGCFLA